MAEQLASLRKQGGALTETVLWTNPNPTSNWIYSNVITLSEDYTHFKYIQVTFRASTGDSSTRNILIPTDEFATASGTGVLAYSGYYQYASTAYSRHILANSTTSLSIETSRQAGGTGVDNSIIIPITITGLK